MQGTRLVAVVLLLVVMTPVGAAQSQPETDNTVTRIGVGVDGDARWSVVVRTRLETDRDVRSYREFQERVRANESRYLGQFSDRIASVVAAADGGTDRSMAARNFSLSTSIQQVPRRWGVITYTFTWTGFARVENGSVVVDGVGGGLLIARNDTLVVSGPARYTATDVGPTPTTRDNGTLSWRGRRDFGPGEPTVRYEPAATPTGDSGLTAVVSPALVGALGLVAAVGGFLLYRRRNGAGTASDADDGGETTAVLTDGDRVVELVTENGGQVKQAAIADELDWSASKTSRVLSRLADDGRIEKLRLGRENVISLPDEE